MTYKADKIYNHLFQGGWPPPGDGLAKAGIDVLVLCAQENQDAGAYEGVEVICAPGDDDERPHRFKNFINTWTFAAAKTAEYVRAGKNVLVTCVAGHNRSGLVTAIALHHLTNKAGEECIRHIQRHREGALGNELFVRYLTETFL